MLQTDSFSAFFHYLLLLSMQSFSRVVHARTLASGRDASLLLKWFKETFLLGDCR